MTTRASKKTGKKTNTKSRKAKVQPAETGIHFPVVGIGASTGRLETITHILPVLMAYIDEYEQHQFANKMYTDWFGVAPYKIIGKNLSEVWEENSYLRISANLKISLSGKQVTFDIELSDSKNTKKYVNITFIPDVDRNKHICGVMVLIEEASNRLEIETLNRKRLLDAAHISRLSSMGEMASEIAHELNQPLAAISIYSDACRRMIISGKAGQDTIIQSLTDISHQAERAGEVIRRIREFASKKELSFAKTDINELAQEAMHLLAAELRLHNVQLRFSLDEDLPMADVDKILIEQVIFNLAHNAIEAMDNVESSQRLLHIHTSVCAAKEIEVGIEDTGPGLSTEQIKQIFSPFHTTKPDGMGLGLAISKSIIETHQGRLWTVSNESGGSIFSFTIPIENLERNSAT